MTELVIQLGQHAIALTLPGHLLADGIFASLKQASASSAISEKVVISEAPDRSFALKIGTEPAETGLKRGQLLIRLLDGLARAFALKAQVPVLRAAAVKRGDGALLIAGPRSCGKSSLAAWFIEKGFSLIADDQVAVLNETGSLGGYPTPLAFAAQEASHLTSLADVASAPMARLAERILVGLKPNWLTQGSSHPCRMMIFPSHVKAGRAGLHMLDTASAALRLKALRLSPDATDDEDHRLIQMAQDIPAVALSYSDYGDIDGLIDHLARLTIDEKLSPKSFTRFITGIGRPQGRPGAEFAVPERSDRLFSPFMTIGMATYDDYDGVYFSLQAMRLYHADILDQVEFLILDNHPDGPCSAALKRLEKHIPNLRYVPAGDVTGTAIRGRLFSEAGGEIVLCMDCHVLFTPGSLASLIAYFRKSPSSNDLIQGPMIRDNLSEVTTHWIETWEDGMFGKWAADARGETPDAPPFEITFQGLGVFACRRAAWPGFNPAFRGFGGEEGYIHEKFRQAGGRVLCLPALRWLHRFERPLKPSYPLTWDDRIRNYVIGFREIGWDTQEMQEHFRERMGRREADRVFTAVERELNGEPAADADDEDAPYDLRTARLGFVAEVTVPALQKAFAVTSVACTGRGAPLWGQEFSRQGVSATVIEPLAPAEPFSLVCCFEAPNITTAALAEELIRWLTALAPTVVFVPLSAGTERTNKKQQEFWTALFARQGYVAVDVLGSVLAHDPRIEPYYQRGITVFSRKEHSAESVVARPRARRKKATEPQVSVVLPVHNGAAHLASAIESVLLQSHRAFELIIVNDGSTDNSGAIAADYAKVDKRITVIHQDNHGEAVAVNAGFAKARFALVARLDHDDIALPDRLAQQVAFLKKYEDVAAVGGTMRFIDGDGKLTGPKKFFPLTPADCHKALADTTVAPISNPSAMIRKAAFDKVGGYRPQFRYACDLDFWLRFDEGFKLANLPEILIDYRLHGANATHRHRFDQELQAQIARQAALSRRKGLPDPVAGWTALDLDKLATFTLSDDEKSRIYRELFEAALFNLARTKDAAYLKLADRCLALLPVDKETPSR
jgi:hypothetical protein